ncbi:MAG: Swt1 family HEPN domain-containing protein [Acidimicrobiales bacterium]
MAASNRDRVGKALELVGAGLGPFVDRRMTARSPQGGHWKAAYPDLNVGSDPSALINVILDHWQEVFRDELRSTGRNLVGEIRDWRNKWAHQEAFSTDDAYRALDSIERLLAMIDAPQAAEVGQAKTAIMRAKAEAEARSATPSPAALFAEPAAGLKPWREVITPHDDVSRGKFNVAEFAANLSQVAAGRGLPEYTDPVEFFRRTYLTVGLRALLTQAAQRITGAGGAPVVDLQTNFGGGKTHSMIALFHLFGGLAPAAFPQEIHELLDSAGVKALPSVHRAVVVGTDLRPGQPDTKADGTEVRTIWGEIAWRLGGPDGFAMVAEADRTATNPGSAMHELFERYSPCLILIDEWVAYARQLFETRELLPGGLFETQFSFAQTLADAAIATAGVLLVVSLPVSDDPARLGATPIGSEAEVGGVTGQEAARRLGNVLGRTETSWRPASAEESFEIVRRRLFEPLPGDMIRYRDATARSFAEYYRAQAADFPGEARDPAYVDRIKAAYPIHPELFARLYEDWSTLEGFQRTRGVLRLMAAVISALWSAGDQSPLILPASVPLDNAAVQTELTRNLDAAWLPILDTDIDGPTAVPRQVDTANPALGRYRAAQRTARAVFLASAPRTASANLGVELGRVKLGCALPGEAAATFGDALGRLTDRSSYLYVEGARYWYGTKASVARRARDLIEQLLSTRRDDLHAHLITRLRELSRERGEFTAVHVCPASPGEVPDTAECRLVVLGPDAPHANRDEHSQAIVAARTLLEQRGSGARLNRNMVLFLAADQRRLEELERGVAEYLAWAEIHDHWEELGLDAFGRNQAGSKKADAERGVGLRLAETYHWALVPSQADPSGPVTWETTKVDGSGGLALRASAKLVHAGVLATAYPPELLRGRLGEGGPLASLWSEGHVTVNALWEAFARYVYLPRLRSVDVLTRTVADGPGSIAWESHGFAVADAFEAATGRYAGLVAGAGASQVTGTTLVVRPDVAAAQLRADSAQAAEMITSPGPLHPGSAPSAEGSPVAEPAPAPEAKPAVLRRFYGVAHLDPERYQRDFAKLAAEIIANLAGHLGTDLDITVEIRATNDAGFPDSIVRTVSENAGTLKLSEQGFEPE